MLTHSGVSYSQTFTSSLLVLPVVVAMTMMLLAGNLLVAIGLLSVFAMIRFRNVLKDTRDTSLSCGPSSKAWLRDAAVQHRNPRRVGRRHGILVYPASRDFGIRSIRVVCRCNGRATARRSCSARSSSDTPWACNWPANTTSTAPAST